MAFTIVLFILVIPVVSEFSCCGFALNQMTKDTRHLFVCRGDNSHSYMKYSEHSHWERTCQAGNYLSVLKEFSKVFVTVIL